MRRRSVTTICLLLLGCLVSAFQQTAAAALKQQKTLAKIGKESESPDQQQRQQDFDVVGAGGVSDARFYDQLLTKYDTNNNNYEADSVDSSAAKDAAEAAAKNRKELIRKMLRATFASGRNNINDVDDATSEKRGFDSLGGGLIPYKRRSSVEDAASEQTSWSRSNRNFDSLGGGLVLDRRGGGWRERKDGPDSRVDASQKDVQEEDGPETALEDAGAKVERRHFDSLGGGLVPSKRRGGFDSLGRGYAQGKRTGLGSEQGTWNVKTKQRGFDSLGGGLIPGKRMGSDSQKELEDSWKKERGFDSLGDGLIPEKRTGSDSKKIIRGYLEKRKGV